MDRDQNSFNSTLVFLGTGLLLFGALEYILSRPTDSTHLRSLIDCFTNIFHLRIHIYGNLGGVLPDFIHPLSFSLLTMAIFPQAQRGLRAMICLAWLSIDLLFELGQCFNTQISQLLPKILSKGHILDLLTGYFISGTYDHLDILAICLGALTAFIISELNIVRRCRT